MIKIYALINPIDENPFYIGATVLLLKTRLSGHCSPITCIQEYPGIFMDKANLIADIISKGLRPKILLLKEVEFDEVDVYEKYYYDLYISQGYTLLQANDRFQYSIIKKSVKNKLCQPST